MTALWEQLARRPSECNERRSELSLLDMRQLLNHRSIIPFGLNANPIKDQ